MMTDSVSAPERRPTRRTPLARDALPANVVPFRAARPDPHLAWLAEHDRLCARGSAGLSEEAYDAVCERILELRDLAAAVPARTLQGARAMLAMGAAADEDQDTTGMARLSRNALATLDRLAGRVRP